MMGGEVNHQADTSRRNLLNILFTAILLALYLAYIIFIVKNNQGPIDYETFMRIGEKFLHGENVYGVNSYYPLPYVMIFALFAALPRSISLVVWVLLPVLAALYIAKGRSWVLLFAPLFAHFLGGQTALFGMLGFWGYRRSQDCNSISGGMWLALTTLKPQLAVIPFCWAGYQWIKHIKDHRRIPRQAAAWLVTTTLIYLPSFVLQPDWVTRWLSNPRPLFVRAMSGFVPRSLLLLFQPGWLYWLILFLFITGSGIYLLLRFRKQLKLDTWMLWYFVISPLVHDYDLIQIIPLLETRKEQWTAILLGIPTLAVIVMAYGIDSAWYVVTLIGIGLLGLHLFTLKNSVKSNLPTPGIPITVMPK